MRTNRLIIAALVTEVKTSKVTVQTNFYFLPQIKPKRPTVGKKSKKGAGWKFTLDLTHPVEDGILDSANFVSLAVFVKPLVSWTLVRNF